jgi:iduronate 2-sulfatase
MVTAAYGVLTSATAVFRVYMKIIFRLCAAALLVFDFARAADAPRPNILLICVDDLKPLLGCYGDRTARTPNIDRLAARGTRFDRAYCNQALCAPSRNSLMTGLRPTSTGIYDLATNFRVATPDAVTLGQLFQRHGWRTGSLGKVMHRMHGNFEDAASWSVPHWIPTAGVYVTDTALALRQAATDRAREKPVASGVPPGVAFGPLVEMADLPDDAYPDGQVANEAIKRLRAGGSGPPFFLAVGFFKPHLPFSAPRKYWELYDRAQFPLAAVQQPPAGAPGYAAVQSVELRLYTDFPTDAPLNAEKQRELIHGYHAATSFMDAQVGRVIDELDRLQLSGNTIVVLWGDHGWHLGDHGLWGKMTNYEDAARIPLLVVDPRRGRAGTSSRALVETVDLYPTLVELAGLSANISQNLDGRSFADVIKDPAMGTKEAVFHVVPRTLPGGGVVLGRAVRTEHHRLVEWKKPGAAASTAELELYDCATDPLEKKNLVSEQPAVVDRLRAFLAAHPETVPVVPPPLSTAPRK